MLRSCTLPLAQRRLRRLFTFWENLSQVSYVFLEKICFLFLSQKRKTVAPQPEADDCTLGLLT